ncbi:hypothetical protein BR93DRAFT_273407 [Coniochaeta sp. PMI_546]|nr:hypothetical protein BR93DRAFT_273407 [Coniochaeta sp. PMI_546]
MFWIAKTGEYDWMVPWPGRADLGFWGIGCRGPSAQGPQNGPMQQPCHSCQHVSGARSTPPVQLPSTVKGTPPCPLFLSDGCRNWKLRGNWNPDWQISGAVLLTALPLSPPQRFPCPFSGRLSRQPVIQRVCQCFQRPSRAVGFAAPRSTKTSPPLRCT